MPTKPLFRLFDGSYHFYTDNCSEKDRAQSEYGSSSEGVACFLSTTLIPNTTDFYRIRLREGPRFYTANGEERTRVIRNGATDEGAVGYIATTQLPGTVPLYRLAHPTSNDHFYTINERERDFARGFMIDEGIAGYAWTDGPNNCPDKRTLYLSSDNYPSGHNGPFTVSHRVRPTNGFYFSTYNVRETTRAGRAGWDEERDGEDIKVSLWVLPTSGGGARNWVGVEVAFMLARRL